MNDGSSRVHGVDHHNAKLDDSKVAAMLAMRGRPYRYIAEQFGVSLATVSNILNRKIWAHVPDERA